MSGGRSVMEAGRRAMDGMIARVTRRLSGCMLLLALAVPGHAATVEYIHTDALGSVVAVTDSTGTVIDRREYEPYGRQLTPIPAEDGPGYTGHVTDAVTGLSYMQQRYYDPTIGRFLSVDPVTAHAKPGQNFNRYWYVNNNPYKFIDPDGRVAIVTRMKDGLIEVNLPIQFKGPAASEPNISAFKSQVQGMSGTYKVGGKDTQVNFKVSDITKDTPRAARNTVTLTDGPTDRASGSSAAQVGGKKAWIDASDRFVANGTAPHEMLHLTDNDDRYKIANGVKVSAPNDNNIMNVVPGVVDSTNIQEIMQSRNNIFRTEEGD